MMRLDKLLAHAGYGSRVEVNRLIKDKQVTINNKIVTKGSIKIDLNKDIVAVNQSTVTYQKYSYIMLNKPAGYLCANGSYRYPTVFSLIHENIKNLFIVGRLDVDTEGLLILSNDGKFGHNIISGKKDINKEYLVKLKEPFNTKYIADIEKGIKIDNDICKPAKIIFEKPNVVRLIISEGKYHQVKRMMIACDNEVVKLKRTKIGSLELGEDLALGSYRHLTEDDLNLIIEKK